MWAYLWQTLIPCLFINFKYFSSEFTSMVLNKRKEVKTSIFKQITTNLLKTSTKKYYKFSILSYFKMAVIFVFNWSFKNLWVALNCVSFNTIINIWLDQHEKQKWYPKVSPRWWHRRQFAYQSYMGTETIIFIVITIHCSCKLPNALA